MLTLPWFLVRARLRKNLFRALATSAVVALALISLLSMQGISHSTRNSLVNYALSKLPAGQSNLTINSSQAISSAAESQAIDSYLGKNLLIFSKDAPTPEIIYRALSDPHGTSFYFGAIENIGSAIRLNSGRLPGLCNPSLCEVMQIGGDPKVSPRPETYGLKIVGQGEIGNSLLYAGTMGPPKGTALLLTTGISSASALPKFANSDGTSAWVAKIDIGKIAQLGSDPFIARMVAFEDRLSIDYPHLVVTWPQDALSNASDEALSFSGKLSLLKFAVATLLLAFLALITIRQRRDHFQFRASLSRIGTPKPTLVWELFYESAIPLLAGVVFAGILSPLIPRALQGFNYRSGLADIYFGWPKYLLLYLVAQGLVLGLTLWRDSAWLRIQILALTSSVVFFTQYLQQNSVTNSRYFIIPFLYAAGPVVICYLILRNIISFWRSRQKVIFILLKEFFGLWQGVASMIALASILAMLALGYGSGLSQQVATQAQNAVPLDLSLLTGSNLIRPLDLAGASDYAHLQPGSQAFPILRTGTSIRGQNSVAESLSLIGMPADALALADPQLQKFVNSPSFNKTIPQRGIPLGATREISVSLSGIPPVIDLLGWFVTSRGTYLSATLSGQSNQRSLVLKGQVPAESVLVAFEFRESSNYLSRRLHAINEGNYSVPKVVGIGSIEKVLFDGKSQVLPRAVWNLQNFPFAFDGQSLYLQPKSEAGITSVVTDPETAKLAVNGLLTLLGNGNTYIQVRVGAVTPYFPSAGDRFVIAELGALQNKMSQSDLGTIDPIEVWIKTPRPEKLSQILAAPPYEGLLVKSRIELQDTLSLDPNNVGLLDSYRIALLLALLMSLLVALATLPLLYREGGAVLFQLEVLGYQARELKNSVRFIWRVALLVGLVVGVGVGVLIGRIFVSPSIPLLEEALLVLLTYLLIEFTGALLSRSFLKEEKLVGR